MVFCLGGRALGAEVPLLSHDLTERLPGVRRPTQDVLLRALSDGLHEIQSDPVEPLRMRKEESDRLLAWNCGDHSFTQRTGPRPFETQFLPDAAKRKSS